MFVCPRTHNAVACEMSFRDRRLHGLSSLLLLLRVWHGRTTFGFSDSSRLYLIVTNLSDASPAKPADAFVCRAMPEYDESLAAFFRLVWGATGTGADVAAARAATAAANPSEPGCNVPEFIFVLNHEVIGYLGAVPVSFWNGRVEIPTYWLKGFMVHPDHRNGPVGFNLLKEALNVIGPSGALVAAPAARRLFTALGFVECGAIPNYVSILRPSRVMSHVDISALGGRLPQFATQAFGLAQKLGAMRAIGGLFGVGQQIWKTGRALGFNSYLLDISGALPGHAEVDDLWQSVRKEVKAAAVRDARFLSWRFSPAPGELYEAASVRDKTGRLVAIVVVRRPSAEGDERLHGIKLAVLADILFAPGHSGAGLMALKCAEGIAIRMGADALLCSATANAVKQLLSRRAYFQITPNVFFLVRDPRGSCGLPTAISDWWVTRGDGRADDAF